MAASIKLMFLIRHSLYELWNDVDDSGREVECPRWVNRYRNAMSELSPFSPRKLTCAGLVGTGEKCQ
jgi:hypothetical protein